MSKRVIFLISFVLVLGIAGNVAKCGSQDAFLVPQDGLLVWYKFDTDLSDSSGNGFDGIDIGGVTVQDGMLTLDGSDFVDIPFDGNNPFGGSVSFTVVMSVRTTTPPILFSSSIEGEMDAFSFYSSHASLDEMWPGWPGCCDPCTEADVVQDNQGIGWMGTGPVPILDGGWHHVAVTFDLNDPCNPGGFHNLYFDGEDPVGWTFDFTAPGDDQIWPWETSGIEYYICRIGSSFNLDTLGAGGVNLVGDVGFFTIYTRVLTPGEIKGFVPTDVSNPDPANYGDHVRPDANLCFQAHKRALCMDPDADPNLKGPFNYDVWFGTEPNVVTMTQLANDFQPANCNDVMCFDPCAGDLADGTRYYWRVDINDLDPGDPCFYEGPYFSFRTWGFADDQEPADGEGGVKPSVILSWAEDDYAVSRDVYFDPNETAVEDANTATAGVYRGSTVGVDPCDPNRNTYDPPEPLDLLTNYFWRIDEVNVVTIKGDVWSFETAGYFVVDDFEFHLNDTAIKAVWKDYWVNDTGAEVFVETDETHVYGGDKSMRFYFRGILKKYPGSEAEADIASLQSGPDWTRGGAKALVLYFQGDPDNLDDTTGVVGGIHQDQMYVALEDGDGNSGIVKYPDMNDIKETSWQEWNIDLADPCLADVNMANIAKVYIGFGGADKTGQTARGAGDQTLSGDIVWFDDITLHPSRCVPAVSWAYGDVDRDCNIGVYDLDAMSDDWLESDFAVAAEEPNRVGLLVEYLFDSDYSDTSGPPYYTGQPSAVGTSVSGGVLNLDGGGLEYGDCYVEIGGDFNQVNPFAGLTDFSIAMSFKTSVPGMLISSAKLEADLCDPELYWDMAMLVYAPPPKKADCCKSGDCVVFEASVVNWVGSEPLGVKDNTWHHTVVTYDADGAADGNGLIKVYLDCEPPSESARMVDPWGKPWNIPCIDLDHVLIGSTFDEIAQGEGVGDDFIGDIDNVRIYDYILPHSAIVWLCGETMTYFPNTSPANLVPKVPPGGPFDPNNLDIINFRDYAVMANNWLMGPILFP